MSPALTRTGDALQARLLSTVVTRVIKAPAVSLTDRHVAAPETVLVPTRHGDVRCLVTRAAAGAPLAAGTTPPPVHVNVHGGAFLIGAPRQDDHLVRGIAGEVGATVVNVDYSTAPSAVYPQAHEECYDVLRWVQRSGDAMGWDSGRVSIGGGSAGANLALGALELLRQAGGPTVRAAVLLVPVVDLTLDPGEYVSPLPPGAGKPPRPFVGPRLMRITYASYFPDVARRCEPLASPLLGDEEIAALPPLLVVSAEQDSLRPQIERFVKKGLSRGVAISYHCARDVDHDFPVRPKGPGLVALRDCAERVRAHLMTHLS